MFVLIDMVLEFILAATIIVSLLAFSGVFLLKIKRTHLAIVLPLVVSFAAGVMLGDVFIHIAPESAAALGDTGVFFYLLFGVVAFLIIEKLLLWHHHKGAHIDAHEAKLTPAMVLIGDGAHNFFDGVIIAASFLNNFNLGVLSTFAIILHEIPQEIGDFGVLLSTGLKPKKVILYTFVAQLTAIAGGLITYFFLTNLAQFTQLFLPIAGGGLLYIATSDIIPELNKEVKLKENLFQIIALVLGITVMYYLKVYTG